MTIWILMLFALVPETIAFNRGAAFLARLAFFPLGIRRRVALGEAAREVLATAAADYRLPARRLAEAAPEPVSQWRST